MVWLAPTIGLLITSFRPQSDILSSGWWTVLFSPRFTLENYTEVLTSQGLFAGIPEQPPDRLALVFIQNPAANPMTRQIQSLLSQYGTEWHLLAAGAFILMLVPLIVFFSLQRYFVQGLLAGSVK